jgi:hypothetical protein
MKLVLIAGCLLYSMIAVAQDDRARSCDAATLKDGYGLLVTGTRTLGSGVIETFVTVSMVTFDGKGAFTANGVSHGSTTGVRKGPAAGTYAVNSDCTGTWTTNIPGVPPIVADFVIVDRGREIRAVSVSAGEISTGNARRK